MRGPKQLLSCLCNALWEEIKCISRGSIACSFLCLFVIFSQCNYAINLQLCFWWIAWKGVIHQPLTKWREKKTVRCKLTEVWDQIHIITLEHSTFTQTYMNISPRWSPEQYNRNKTGLRTWESCFHIRLTFLVQFMFKVTALFEMIEL